MAGRSKKDRSPTSISSPFPTPNNHDLNNQPASIDEEEIANLDRDSLLPAKERHFLQRAVLDEIAKSANKGHNKNKPVYTNTDKLRAALAYLNTSSFVQAGRLASVPPSTIRTWKHSAPWWEKAMIYATACQGEQLDADYHRIQSLANTAVQDRLEHGDERVGKDGTLIRVKVSAKDSMVISGIARDKQTVLRGQPTSITEKISDKERLDNLATTILEAIGSNSRVIEGEIGKESNT